MKQLKGAEEIKQFLPKLLDENTSLKLRSILTSKPLVYYFGEAFAEEFMQTRVDKNISLQSLRLTGKNYDTVKHKNYSGYLKEVRHITSDEVFNGDVIFLQDNRVVIFDTTEMIAIEYDGGEKFEFYNDLFEKYWN